MELETSGGAGFAGAGATSGVGSTEPPKEAALLSIGSFAKISG